MERALHGAASGGHAELVSLVLDRGASVITEVSEKRIYQYQCESIK